MADLCVQTNHHQLHVSIQDRPTCVDQSQVENGLTECTDPDIWQQISLLFHARCEGLSEKLLVQIVLMHETYNTSLFSTAKPPVACARHT